jgi:hypothetical protein
MRLAKSLTKTILAVIATGAAVAVSAGTASASTHSADKALSKGNAIEVIGHVPTGLIRSRDGMVTLSRLLPSNSPDLPKLPRGEEYAPVVWFAQEIHAPNIPLPQAPAQPATTTRVPRIPETASGCTPFFSPHTCIYVYGKGLEVIYWTTGVNLRKPPSNPEDFYLLNGKVEQIHEFFGTDASGFQLDPYGWDFTYFYYVNGTPEPEIFPNNTQVCNYWTGAAIISKPCERVFA